MVCVRLDSVLPVVLSHRMGLKQTGGRKEESMETLHLCGFGVHRPRDISLAAFE